MAPHLYARRVHYDEFCQRVKRHAPSSLLPIIAAVGAQYGWPETWFQSPYKKYMPWNLAEVARVSLAYGNDHRSSSTERDLLECCAAYTGIADPDLGDRTWEAFGKFMLRMSSEQSGHQLPILNEFARSIALFEQTTVDRPLEVLDDNWTLELLGCSISEYVSVALLFHTGALLNNGRFNLDWLDEPKFAAIVAEVPAEVIRRIAREQFIVSPAEFRDLQPRRDLRRHRDLWRYQFNPLHARPVVSGIGPDLLIPVPNLLVQKVSPLGIYYTGGQRWQKAFPRDVGVLFESYIGRQLRLLDNAVVHPAITYGKSKRDRRESVDWIVVFDEAILLVEVKSTRSTEAIRSGGDAAAADLQQRLAKAYKQIATTAEQIRERHAAFNAIPHDRPIVGLVLTLEPFHVVNASPYRQWLPDGPDPVMVCAAYELERLVTIKGRSLADVLLEVVQDEVRREWSVGGAAERANGAHFGRNAIIDAAWTRLSWGSDEQTGETT